MIQMVKERLRSFGYEFQQYDDPALVFSIRKTQDTIKNDCNVSAVPDGLLNIAVDMAVGDFLRAKKTFSPESLSGLNLDTAVKQIQAGDTSTTFAVGEGSSTPEQRFSNLKDFQLEASGDFKPGTVVDT